MIFLEENKENIHNLNFHNEDSSVLQNDQEKNDIINKIKFLLIKNRSLLNSPSIYDVSKQENKIEFNITNPKEKRVIYCLVNTVSQTCLVGETGSSLKKRFSNYKAKFNNPDYQPVSSKKRQLLEEIRENPHHFKLMVIDKVPLDSDISQKEKDWIQQIQSITSVYNDNKGGGGGRAHGEEKEFSYAVPLRGPLTPEKNHPIGIGPTTARRLDFGEETDSSLPVQFYRIKDVSQPSRVYVGVSGNPRRRFREHVRNAKKSPKKATRLVKALKDKGDFVFGIYPILNGKTIPCEKRSDFTFFSSAGEVEKHLIEVKSSCDQGLNSNKGGGGSLPRLACFL